jgi:cytochrome c
MKKVVSAIAFVLLASAFLQLRGTGSGIPSGPQGINPDKGIGPFKSVTLAPVDKAKVKTGQSVFTAKCSLCHELDIKKVGPPLRNVTKDYHPEFILNMIVNPLGMQKDDEVVKGLVKQYNNIPMPDQKISHEDALAILDYLRSVAK